MNGVLLPSVSELVSGRPSQWAAAPETRQFPARFLAHRSRARAGIVRTGTTWPRSPRSWPPPSARRSRRPGSTHCRECPPLAGPVYVDREMWEKVVLEPALERVQVHVGGSDHGADRDSAVNSRDPHRRGYRHRHSGRPAAAPVRALPSCGGRARPDPGGHGHRTGASGGAREAPRRNRGGAKQRQGREAPSRCRFPSERRICRASAGCGPRSGRHRVARDAYVEEAARWLPEAARPTHGDETKDPRPGAGGGRQRRHARLREQASRWSNTTWKPCQTAPTALEDRRATILPTWC